MKMTKRMHNWAAMALAGMLLAGITTGPASAQMPPEWWGFTDDDTGESVLFATSPVDHKAAANVGQAKWIAYRALMELRAVLPLSAARIDEALLDEGILPSWDFPVTAAEKAAHRGVLSQGQLKALAAPFYDELFDVAQGWLDAEMSLYQTKQTTGSGSDVWPQNHYPWGAAVGTHDPTAVVSIGQLKAAFCLDFWADREATPDQVPDLWEHYLVGLSPTDTYTAISQINGNNVNTVGNGLNAGIAPNPSPDGTSFDPAAQVSARARRATVSYDDPGAGEPQTTISVLGGDTINLTGEETLSALASLLEVYAREGTPQNPGEDLANGAMHAEVTTPGIGEKEVFARGGYVFWQSAVPVPYNVRVNRLLVTRSVVLSNNGSSVVSVQPVTFLIAKGGTRSQRIELFPDFQDGRRHVSYLINPLSEETTEDCGAAIAAALEVNDGDADSDYVLDYADGLSDMFTSDGISAAGEAQSRPFYPLEITSVDPDAQITISYSGSNPQNMTAVTDPGDGEAPQALPAGGGGIRVWNSDGDTIRSAASNYVPPATAATASQFGVTEVDNNLRLFVESVLPSTGIGDQTLSITVDPPGSDAPKEYQYAFTSLRTCIHGINDDNTTFRLYGLRPSLPHPTVDDTDITISDLKPTADGSGLTADIQITGKIHSAVCDITPRAPGTNNGTITTAYIGLNGHAPPATGDQTVAVTTVKKDADPGSLARPYPYAGAFNKTLADVPVLEGNNTVKVSVHDPVFRLTGSVTVPFTVEAQPPGAAESGGAGAVLAFSGNDPANIPSNSLRLDYFDASGSAVIDGLILTQDNSTQYSSGNTVVTFSAAPSFSAAVRDSVTFTLTNNSTALVTGKVAFETDLESELLTWGSTDVTHTDYIGWSVSHSGTGVFDTTGPGEFHPMAVKFDGPRDLLRAITTYNMTTAQGDGSTRCIPVSQSTTNGEFYVSHEEEPYTLAAFFASPIPGKVDEDPNFDLASAGDPTPADPQWEDEAGEPELGELQYTYNFLDRNKDGQLTAADIATQVEKQVALFGSDITSFSFHQGMMKGFFGNPIDTGKDFVGMVAGVGKLLWKFSPVGITWQLASGELYQNEIKAVKKGWDLGRDFYEKAKSWIPKLTKFLGALGVNATATIVSAMTTGTFPGADGLSEEERIAVDVVFMLLTMADDWWTGLSNEKRGYYIGYITFEVVAAVVAGVVTAPAGGAGAGAMLARHTPKLLHIVRMVKPVLKALNLSDLPSPGLPKLQALIDKMDDLDAPLMAAKLGDWCFVGGTAVLTLSGPMAIEAVEPGMMVLSAPESGDGRVELRPVTAVHRNIASEIVEITYDHDGERETPDATIESTVGHPYWVEERAAFAPAADLEPGDTLRLATGRMVAITSVTTRSGVPGSPSTTSPSLNIIPTSPGRAAFGCIIGIVIQQCKMPLVRLEASLQSGKTFDLAADDALAAVKARHAAGRHPYRRAIRRWRSSA